MYQYFLAFGRESITMFLFINLFKMVMSVNGSNFNILYRMNFYLCSSTLLSEKYLNLNFF